MKEYKKSGSEAAFDKGIFSYDLDMLYLSHRIFAFRGSGFLGDLQK